MTKVICLFGKSEYFFNQGWTGQISLILHDNFRFRRNRILPVGLKSVPRDGLDHATK